MRKLAKQLCSYPHHLIDIYCLLPVLPCKPCEEHAENPSRQFAFLVNTREHDEKLVKKKKPFKRIVERIGTF